MIEVSLAASSPGMDKLLDRSEKKNAQAALGQDPVPRPGKRPFPPPNPFENAFLFELDPTKSCLHHGHGSAVSS